METYNFETLNGEKIEVTTIFPNKVLVKVENQEILHFWLKMRDANPIKVISFIKALYPKNKQYSTEIFKILYFALNRNIPTNYLIKEIEKIEVAPELFVKTITYNFPSMEFIPKVISIFSSDFIARTINFILKHTKYCVNIHSLFIFRAMENKKFSHTLIIEAFLYLSRYCFMGAWANPNNIFYTQNLSYQFLIENINIIGNLFPNFDYYLEGSNLYSKEQLDTLKILYSLH